jgi:hypothetical protein
MFERLKAVLALDRAAIDTGLYKVYSAFTWRDDEDNERIQS